MRFSVEVLIALLITMGGPVPLRASMDPSTTWVERDTVWVRVWDQRADLDQDGRPEHVTVWGMRQPAHDGEVLVRVNERRLRIRAEVEPRSFEIVDIDSTDRLREISLFDSGFSDDPTTTYLHYDRRGLRVVGSILSWSPVTDGSGLVHGEVRGAVLHTWWHPASFRLTRVDTLERIVPPFQMMGWPVRLKRDLPLSFSAVDGAPMWTARTGASGAIRLTDDIDWCQLVLVGGEQGWFRVSALVVGELEPVDWLDGLQIVD